MCHALIKFWFLKIVPTEINPIQDKFVCKKRQVHFNPHNLAAPKLIVESEKTPLNLKATNLTPSNQGFKSPAKTFSGRATVTAFSGL